MIRLILLFLSFTSMPMTSGAITTSNKSLAIISYAASQQQNNNAITGVITDTSNRPLNRIRVELLNEVEMSVAQVYTDAAGRYSFRNLSQGTFIVKAHSDGVHAGQSARVALYQARATGGSHNEQQDIVLKTIDEAKGTSLPTNSGSAFVQEIPENARKAYEHAVKQLENGKQTEQGIASLKEAISLFPAYYSALERLGVEYVKAQRYEPAREPLTKALEVNPNGASSYYALGVAQFNLRQLPEAAESLRHSLLLAPESPNAAFAHFYLGLALLKSGKADAAEPHLKKSYESGGNSIPADVHMHLAKYYSDNKRYKEAAEQLELFLKQAPDARDAEAIKKLIKQLRDKAK